MIDQPTQSIKLTLEQLQQLEVVETRLGNLQNEIKIATKQLTAVTNDCSRITKEKDYQQSLFNDLEVRLNEKQSALNTLDERKLVVSDEVSKLNQSIAVKTEAITRKEMEMKEREDLVSNLEKEIDIRQANLTKSESAHKENKETFTAKVENIREAIKNV